MGEFTGQMSLLDPNNVMVTTSNLRKDIFSKHHSQVVNVAFTSSPVVCKLDTKEGPSAVVMCKSWQTPRGRRVRVRRVRVEVSQG